MPTAPDQLPAVVALILDEKGDWTIRAADPENRLVVVVVSDHLPNDRTYVWRKRESFASLMRYVGVLPTPEPEGKPKPKLTLVHGGKA